MNATSIGSIIAVCISDKKGIQKRPIDVATMRADFGVEGDAHAGPGHRQVSLLAEESADKVRALGAAVSAGDFGENLLTRGFDIRKVHVGDTIRIGEVSLLVTQLGKTCHHRCAIYDAAGTCVMPTEGIFCRVIRGGRVAPGDEIRLD